MTSEFIVISEAITYALRDQQIVILSDSNSALRNWARYASGYRDVQIALNIFEHLLFCRE